MKKRWTLYFVLTVITFQSSFGQRSAIIENSRVRGFMSFFPDENIAFPGPCYTGGGTKPNDNKSLTLNPNGVTFSYTASFTGFAFLQNGTFAGWGSNRPDFGVFRIADVVGYDGNVKDQGWQVMGGPNETKSAYSDLIYLVISTTCDAPNSSAVDASRNSSFFITLKNNSSSDLSLNVQLGDINSKSTNCDTCAFVISNVSKGSFQTYTANFRNKWGCQYGTCENNYSLVDSSQINGILLTPNPGSTQSGSTINFSILHIGLGKPMVNVTFPDFKKTFESILYTSSNAGANYLWPFFVGAAQSFSPTVVSVTAPGFSISLSSSTGFSSQITLYPSSVTGILNTTPLYVKYSPTSVSKSINTTVLISHPELGNRVFPLQVTYTSLNDEVLKPTYFSLKNQPVEDIAKIEGQIPTQEVWVVSMLGDKELVQIQPNDNGFSVDFSRFKTGVYFLEIISPKGRQPIKVVKI